MSKPVIEPTATLQSARSHGVAGTHTPTPLPAITSFDVEPGDHSLYVSWQGDFRTRMVRIWYVETGTANKKHKSNRHAAGEMHITGLKGNTRYQVGIDIVFGGIELPTPNDRYVTTLMADLTVRGLSVSSTVESLLVLWNSSSDHAYYRVFWIRADRSTGDTGFGSAGGIEVPDYTISGLIGGERYRIEVTAFNADGVASGAQRGLRHASIGCGRTTRMPRDAPSRTGRQHRSRADLEQARRRLPDDHGV